MLLSYLEGYVESIVSRKEGLIREWLGRNGYPSYYVGFSGGKDSTAVLALAARAYPEGLIGVFVHIPGQTVTDNVVAARGVARELGLSWETLRVGDPRELSESIDPSVGGVVYHVIVGRRPYWELLRVKGSPAPPPRPRWCCRYYKEEPMNWLPPSRSDGSRFIVTGVKRADSRARARRWADSCEHLFKPRVGPARLDVTLAPLCDLNHADVWGILEYLGLYGIVRRQYEKWGRSPNCVLCPLASKRQLERAVKQLPTGFLERYYVALRGHGGTLSSRLLRIIEEELVARGELHG